MELRLEKIGAVWPWVARITGTHHRYGLHRQFLLGDIDARQSTKSGARGIFKVYLLEDGLYEIAYPQSWSRTVRYFARIEDDELTPISDDEAHRLAREMDAASVE